MGERDKKIILVKMAFEQKQIKVAEESGDTKMINIHKKNIEIYEKQLKELEQKEEKE